MLDTRTCRECGKRPAFSDGLCQYCMPKQRPQSRRLGSSKRDYTSTSDLKNELDQAFSKYIRIRDADENGMCRCITCSRSGHYKDFHAGHFVSRQYLGTRYEERNVNAQCPTCNMDHGGRIDRYEKNIDDKWGEGTAQSLRDRSRESHVFSREQLKSMIDKYNKRLSNEQEKLL